MIPGVFLFIGFKTNPLSVQLKIKWARIKLQFNKFSVYVIYF